MRLLLLLLLPALAGAGEFPVPAGRLNPRTLDCRPAAVSPVIDGLLDDDLWQQVCWSEPFVDIEGDAKPAPWFETRVAMAWDSACFYCAARMEEPHLWATLTERDAVIFRDNDFELFLDPDGDTHNYAELEINALGTEWDLLITQPYRDPHCAAINGWDIPGLRTAVALQGTLNDPRDTDQGWTLEIAIPWAALKPIAGVRVPPEPGDLWRLNFSRVEWDLDHTDETYTKREGPEHNWVWSPQGLIAMHYPERWGVLRFVDTAESDCDPQDPDLAARRILYDLYYAQRQYQAIHGNWCSELDSLTLGPVPRLYHGPVLYNTYTGWEARLTSADDRAYCITHEGRFTTCNSN